MIFKDRTDAGKQLAELIRAEIHEDFVVLGLPRGGVPVAYEVAQTLGKPFDVIIVRKLGVPWQPELAFGAIGEDDQTYLNQSIINELAITKGAQAEIIAREREEIKKRKIKFRSDRKPLDISGKRVIIVDDGIATGATVEAAYKVAKVRGAKEVIVAAPVAARESANHLATVADKCLFLDTPEHFYAVGQWYQDFSTITDEVVAQIMEESSGVYGS